MKQDDGTLAGLLNQISDLSSPSPTKFRAVRDWFAEQAELDPTDVSVKYTADEKNYGNRAAEALKHAPNLVAFVVEPLKADGLIEVVAQRLLRSPNSVALIIAGRPNGVWNPVKIIFSAGGALAKVLGGLFPNATLQQLDTTALPSFPPKNLVEKQVELSLAFIEATKGVELDEFEEARQHLKALATKLASIPGSRIRFKRASASANLGNRISEALAHIPELLVVAVDESLRTSALSTAERLLESAPASAVLVMSKSAHRSEWAANWKLPPLEDNRIPSPPIPAGDEATVEEVEPEPGYQRNRTVADLQRYIPFDASAGNLIEEHVNTESRFTFETKALAYIGELAKDSSASLLVLTGDAGHGKTHICRRLLIDGGLGFKESMAAMCGDLSGHSVFDLYNGRGKVRILKDLSEIAPTSQAAERIHDLLHDHSSLAVICANEGRLRAVCSLKPELALIVETLEAGTRTGRTSIDPSVHVVNLNYQAVTPHGANFLDSALDHWTKHKARWSKCDSCKAKIACPILANRNYLSLHTDTALMAKPVRDGLLHLVRLAEQAGYVLTIREALIFVGYIITGGIGCEDVEQLHSNGKFDHLRGYDFQRLLFERELLPDQLQRLGILERLRRYDPGRTALRRVDDGLHRELEDGGALGGAVLVNEGRPPSTRDHLRKEQREHCMQLERARRNDYFRAGSGSTVALSRRLGFRYHELFQEIHGGDPEKSEMIKALKHLVKGLHVVQGIRMSGKLPGNLHIVDPAFSRSGSSAAVVTKSIQTLELELVGEARYWRKDGSRPELLRAVDWLDRRLVLIHRAEGQSAPNFLLGFDLLQFEFVMRAAGGVLLPEFDAADRRRLAGRLGVVAEADISRAGGITVFDGVGLNRLFLERDGSINIGDLT